MPLLARGATWICHNKFRAQSQCFCSCPLLTLAPIHITVALNFFVSFLSFPVHRGAWLSYFTNFCYWVYILNEIQTSLCEMLQFFCNKEPDDRILQYTNSRCGRSVVAICNHTRSRITSLVDVLHSGQRVNKRRTLQCIFEQQQFMHGQPSN